MSGFDEGMAHARSILAMSGEVDVPTEDVTKARGDLWRAIKRVEHLRDDGEDVPPERVGDVLTAVTALRQAVDRQPPLQYTLFRRRPYRRAR